MSPPPPASKPADAAWDNLCAAINNYAADETNRDRVAQLLAGLMRPYLQPARFKNYFPFWEQHGFHVTPVHFYQPIPDTRTLPDSLWEKPSALAGLDLNEAAQLRLLREAFPKFRSEYSRFPRTATDKPHEFYFENGLFGGTDALVLYCLVRHLLPRRIIEVGSGFSSRVSAQAALQNGKTELVCIEPYPSAMLLAGFPGLARLEQKKNPGRRSELFRPAGGGRHSVH